jgi:hypothetical protein
VTEGYNLHNLEPESKSESTFDQAKIKSLWKDVEKGKTTLVDAIRKQFNLSE